MYTMLILTVIGILIGAIGFRHEIAAVIGGIFFFVIGFIASIVVSNFIPHYDHKGKPVELAQMRLEGNTGGAFVFGTGSINTRRVFRVMVRNPNGSVTPHEILANRQVEIFEDPELDNSKGFWITKWKIIDKKHPLYKWALVTKYQKIHVTGHQLRVPVGTVVQTFEAQ